MSYILNSLTKGMAMPRNTQTKNAGAKKVRIGLTAWRLRRFVKHIGQALQVLLFNKMYVGGLRNFYAGVSQSPRQLINRDVAPNHFAGKVMAKAVRGELWYARSFTQFMA